jgi:hypothetical protein
VCDASFLFTLRTETPKFGFEAAILLTHRRPCFHSVIVEGSMRGVDALSCGLGGAAGC